MGPVLTEIEWVHSKRLTSVRLIMALCQRLNIFFCSLLLLLLFFCFVLFCFNVPITFLDILLQFQIWDEKQYSIFHSLLFVLYVIFMGFSCV